MLRASYAEKLEMRIWISVILIGGPMAEDPRFKRLKLRDLHILDVVADAGSMAKAAPRLAMSQPAVSRAIAEMEQALGVPVFDRTSAGVEITAYGQALRRRAINVADELKQGLGELTFLSDPTQGEIRIGSTEPMTALAAAIIQRMSTAYPKVTFNLVAADTFALHRMLRAREIDIAVTRMASNFHEYNDLQAEPLFEDELAVIAGRQNPLARRKRLALKDLMSERWLLGSVGSSFLRPFIEEAFRREGLRPPLATVTSGSHALQINLIAAGPFLTILPRAILHYPRPHPTFVALAVRLPTTRRPVGLVRLRHRSMSPICSLFCKLAREAARPMRVGRGELRGR
jgi:DNA-binding transcriptional LysR family regulator